MHIWKRYSKNQTLLLGHLQVESCNYWDSPPSRVTLRFSPHWHAMVSKGKLTRYTKFLFQRNWKVSQFLHAPQDKKRYLIQTLKKPALNYSVLYISVFQDTPDRGIDESGAKYVFQSTALKYVHLTYPYRTATAHTLKYRLKYNTYL